MRLKDDNFESKSDSENVEGSASGDDQDPNQRPKKKRYHRHTQHQIQEMEAFFKECPHPDDKQRKELSWELALEPLQVKFWFQNKRTQMKHCDILRKAAKAGGLLMDAMVNSQDGSKENPTSVPLMVLENGCGSPCIDLHQVSSELAAAAKDADLIILEGMGRSLHTNFDARFKCDALKAAYERAKRKDKSSSCGPCGGMPSRGHSPGGCSGNMPGPMPQGFPGSMPGSVPENIDMNKILDDPELMAAFKDPEIMSALQDGYFVAEDYKRFGCFNVFVAFCSFINIRRY